MYDVQQVQEVIAKNWRTLLGGSLVTVAGLIFIATFLPLIRQEIAYYTKHQATPRVLSLEDSLKVKETPLSEEVLVPVDEDFSVIIPKIRANSRIHKNIDWQNEAVYQKALQTGVAQASGTSTPDQEGNMFLFSHSGVDFYEAARYNAEFYLLGKLVQGDEIVIFYGGKKYPYTVRETKIVDQSAIEYIKTKEKLKTVTLMTCWPAGSTYKRLIVIADQNPL